MVFNVRAAAAAQVSVCAVMTVIVQKESSCNCGSRAILPGFSCKDPAFVSVTLTVPFIPQAALSNHRNKSLAIKCD